jgi:hypothetical protein
MPFKSGNEGLSDLGPASTTSGVVIRSKISCATRSPFFTYE